MKIDLYARCWNEGEMLPFFFMHYDDIVQRYVVFDDGSTDNSLDLLRLNPKVEIRPMPPYADPESRIASAVALQDSCWKESRGRADWVIVTDIDEHLYHPDLRGYLAQCLTQGVTIIPALGYQMLSEKFPEPKIPLCRSVITGACHAPFSKLNIFSPEIEAVNYTAGRHRAAPAGRIVLPARDELQLLHYHYVGFDRVRKRHAEFVTRQRKKDFERRWGRHYSWSEEEFRKNWTRISRNLVDVSRPDLRPWDTHEGPRWWNSSWQSPASRPREGGAVRDVLIRAFSSFRKTHASMTRGGA